MKVLILVMLFASDVIPTSITLRSERKRLPRDVEPISYYLELKNINFDNLTYRGLVNIVFRMTRNSDTIAMNFDNLEISSSKSTGFTLSEVYSHEEFLCFTAAEALLRGQIYEIMIEFAGNIRTDMKGFFITSYAEGDKIMQMASTYFQPDYAHTVFPCFDEPEFKAIFRIAIECPNGYTCHSNMPVQYNLDSLVTFYPTPKMSTYLITFLISKLKIVSSNGEDSRFKVLARPELEGMGDYASGISPGILDAMGAYLNRSYYDSSPFMKIDHVAIYDSAKEAMENWGLIGYRENMIMYDPKTMTSIRKNDVTTTVIHEISHMWFGNLVTCHWWSDIWLNEGFATFFQFSKHLDTMNLGLEDQFITNILQYSLCIDTDIKVSSVSKSEPSQSYEIPEEFDAISYYKSASIIRMMESIIGEDNFRRAMAHYINNKKFSHATPVDVYEALDLFGVNSSEIMESWITQPGYPVLKVVINQDTVTLDQERFIYEDEADDRLYHIPITFTTELEKDFGNLKPAHIMKSATLTLNVSSSGWVIFNKQQKGYYRVEYEAGNWLKLSEALKNDTAQIHPYNRAQIIDDAIIFALSGRLNFSMALEIIDFLRDDVDYAPWFTAIKRFYGIRENFMRASKHGNDMDHYFSHLVDSLVVYLRKDRDDNLFKLLKISAMNFACTVGHIGCVERSIGMFQDFMNNNVPIEPDAQKYAYCTGVRYGGLKEYDFMWKKYQDEKSDRRHVMLDALQCTENKMNIINYLKNSLEFDKINNSATMTVTYSNIFHTRENVAIGWNFIKENMSAFAKALESLVDLFKHVSGFMSRDQLKEMDAFLNNCGDYFTKKDKRCIRAMMTAHDDYLEWIETKEDEIIKWIEVNYGRSY